MTEPKDHELDNCRKALGECQKLLCSSEADVDASIRSKENLLKTFQELQNKHQVGKIYKPTLNCFSIVFFSSPINY